MPSVPPSYNYHAPAQTDLAPTRARQRSLHRRRPLSRRQFLRRLTRAGAGLVLAGVYPFAEAKYCRILRQEIAVPRLPASFDGLRVVFLADTHHGPCVPLVYLRRAMAQANALRPDLILLGGDYVQQYPYPWLPKPGEYVEDAIRLFGALRAPLGVFAVLGNHDNKSGLRARIQTLLAQQGVRELTNTGVWLRRSEDNAPPEQSRLRLCGVDDLTTSVPNLPAALADATAQDAAILLTHNPDYVEEELRDPRVSLVLCGHTHGGQVVVPFYGPPIVPSIFGQKYAHGLVQGPAGNTVFVTRGVGTILPPVRFLCPPEIALLTLRRAA